MADISQRIANIKEYFREMKVANTEEGDFIYITTVFPPSWVLDNRTVEKYGVECVHENGLTYFWGKMSVGFEAIFNAVDFNIKVNREAQEKAVLFNEKVKDLQQIFENEDYDIEKLRTLQLVFSNPEINSPNNVPPFIEKSTGTIQGRGGRSKKNEEKNEEVKDE